jgi:hypothetical protein
MSSRQLLSLPRISETGELGRAQLITQRSQVQILPPLQRITAGQRLFPTIHGGWAFGVNVGRMSAHSAHALTPTSRCSTGRQPPGQGTKRTPGTSRLTRTSRQPGSRLNAASARSLTRDRGPEPRRSSVSQSAQFR